MLSIAFEAQLLDLFTQTGHDGVVLIWVTAVMPIIFPDLKWQRRVLD